ncbi:MAG: metallophosphatase family protein, partial [Actinomycetota bacterium]|nr:metallophosphatase family protein [Actinomycetota bacterium]
SVIVSGHTHMQFDRVVGGRRWVNAGSIGIPYEGEPGAYWALLGPDVSLRRTVYDFETAANAVRNSGCPLASELASWVTTPDPPAKAAAHFERVAGRG